MESASHTNVSSGTLGWVNSVPPFYLLQLSSATSLSLSTLAAGLLVFLAYLSYTPKVPRNAPEFTSDKTIFVGSNGFYTRKWSFWSESVARSKTGQFSFWLGKYHVVGVSGEAARKVFLDNQHLDRTDGAPLHGVGADITPPIHPIFTANFSKGHTYFQRRVLDLMNPGHLSRRLPKVNDDARSVFRALAIGSAGGMINPSIHCYRLILSQGCRMMCADELADTPELFDAYVKYSSILQHTSSGHVVTRPWLPSVRHMKRRYCRYRLKCLLSPVVERRLRTGAPRADDALQFLIDSGDSEDYMLNFLISILFISVANAGKVGGGLLTTLSRHPEWQARIYEEIKAACQAHSTNQDASLSEQLGTLSLDAWETACPFMDLLLREALRIHVSFAMIRHNVSPGPIKIPGTDEVIPSGSFVAYNTGDAHRSERLYPRPDDYDPERFRAGREEFKKESYSFLGWGNGRHRCVGQRWAKLQLNIVIAHAIVMYEWSSCDATGKLIPPIDLKTNFDKHGNSLITGIFCKYTPRQDFK